MSLYSEVNQSSNKVVINYQNFKMDPCNVLLIGKKLLKSYAKREGFTSSLFLHQILPEGEGFTEILNN